MANAKQCDICGEFYAASKVDRSLRAYEYRDTDAVILINAGSSSGMADDQPIRNEEMESCPKCMRKIKEFIDGMKVK